MTKAWAKGSTRRWRTIRAAVLAANALPPENGGNNGRCRVNVPTICTGRATCVHHTRGRATTGDEDLRYLVASCDPCNLHIGDPSTHTNCELCTQLQPDPQPTPRTRW